MAIPLQKFREIVFQLLYAIDMGQANEIDLISLLAKELQTSKKAVKEALERAKQILQHKNELDHAITETSLSYEFERIQSVERNILRYGTFELLFDVNIPPKVAINESIRLAKKFGTPESANFVNALLDNIYKKHQGEQIDSQTLNQAIENLTLSQEAHQKTDINSIENPNESLSEE